MGGELPDSGRRAYGLELSDGWGEADPGDPAATGATTDPDAEDGDEPEPDWTWHDPTAASRRRLNTASAVSIGVSAAVYAGIALVVTRGHPERLPLLFYGLFLVSLIARVRQLLSRPGSLSLALGTAGVRYETGQYTLQCDWDDVEHVMSFGGRQSALALGLRRDALQWEHESRAMPWRKQPFAYRRTVPIEPFIEGDPDNGVLAQVWQLAPRLLGPDPMDGRPRPQPWSTRLLSIMVTAVPFAVVAGTLIAYPWGEEPTPGAIGAVVIQAALIGGLLLGDLWGWNTTTPERLVDWIGRVLRRPRPAERRAEALGAVGRMWGSFAFFLVLGALVALSSSPSTAQTVAKYGPAHDCWSDGTQVVGCLVGGRLVGTAEGTKETCYFREPIAETTTFRCSR
jgi:hypothetical protein